MTVRGDVFMQTCGWNAIHSQMAKSVFYSEFLIEVSQGWAWKQWWKSIKKWPFWRFFFIAMLCHDNCSHFFFCRIYFFKNIFSSIFFQTISKKTFFHNISQSEMPHTRSQWSKQKHFFVYLMKSSLGLSVKAPLLCT